MEKSTLFVTLARLALRELLPESAGGVVDAIQGYLGDQSQALSKALEEAAEQTEAGAHQQRTSRFRRATDRDWWRGLHGDYLSEMIVPTLQRAILC